jgi:hypothetical protein
VEPQGTIFFERSISLGMIKLNTTTKEEWHGIMVHHHWRCLNTRSFLVYLESTLSQNYGHEGSFHSLIFQEKDNYV